MPISYKSPRLDNKSKNPGEAMLRQHLNDKWNINRVAGQYGVTPECARNWFRKYHLEQPARFMMGTSFLTELRKRVPGESTFRSLNQINR